MSGQRLNLWQTNLGRLLAAETEQAALEAAVVATADLLDGPAVGVLKGRSEHLSSVAAHGQDRYIAPLFVEALRLADPRLASRSQRHQELLDDQQAVTLLLSADEQVFGAICVLPGPARDSQEQVRLAVLELALARTVQRIRQLSETSLLYEISQRLSSTLDLEQLLYEVLELTKATFTTSSSRIFLADERVGDLVMTMNPDPQSMAIETQHIDMDGTVAGWVLRNSTGLIQNDPRAATPTPTVNETGVPLGKLICVPLKQADRTLGALMLVNQHDGPDFREDDLRLLTTIAGTIAVAIANARLYERAVRDALTGAYNRGAFDNMLQEYWAGWHQKGIAFALMMIDLDNFKQINDRFGHPTGDATLQTVTRLLWEALREDDAIFRYGGEEFGVLLSGVAEPEHAAGVAERVRTTLDRELTIGSLVRLNISASLGVALHPAHRARSPRELLDLADDAAYQAKRNGKNQFVIATPRK
jgi:diguanylate cyclase (GGDEF)-like protein